MVKTKRLGMRSVMANRAKGRGPSDGSYSPKDALSLKKREKFLIVFLFSQAVTLSVLATHILWINWLRRRGLK